MESHAGPNEGAPLVSVVIPAYNEEARIGGTLRRLCDYLRAQPYVWEVVVVDDGSRDRTGAVVREELPEATLLRHDPNRGKGATVRTGVLAARGDFVAFIDADMATPIAELPRLIAALRQGADIAVGVRNWPDGRDYRDLEPPLRRAFGRAFNLAVRGLGLSEVRDTQCPFKLFPRAVAHSLFGDSSVDSIVFDVEILHLARKRGLRVATVPVTWENVAGSRMHVTARHAWVVLRDLWLIRWQHRGQDRPNPQGRLETR
ncbi:MAG: dolichyl-phosphate beta-glucosyltransferase [Chloroflexota bacterium]